MKKIPMRSCVVNKEVYPKYELIRIVKNKDNEVFIDLSGKANGRGAYLKKDIDTINKAKSSNILQKKLGIEIPNSIYDELLEIINK